MNESLRLGAIGADVATLQRRLNRRGANLNVDHVFGSATDAAVRAFQRANGLVVDGIAGEHTQVTLLGGHPDKRALTQADVECAAEMLGCQVAAIQAVISVESPRGGFLPDGRPVILFERHIMYRRLKDAGIDPEPYVAARPDIVNPKPGGYLGGTAEYTRLAAAKQINESIALESASWGRFQIMGEHWQALGYPSVQAFASQQAISENVQVGDFVQFIRLDREMHKALCALDWPAFAARYNGPNYAINHYAARLAQAFTAHGGVDAPITPEAEQVAAVANAMDESGNAGTDAGASRRGKRKAQAEATA